jgi:hypothetical protein
MALGKEQGIFAGEDAGMAASETNRFTYRMSSRGRPAGLWEVQKIPAVTSKESPGRKNPTSRPVSAKTIATRPRRPPHSTRP